MQRQDNSWNTSWPKFWADQRIGDLIKRILADQPDRELKDLEKQMREKCVSLPPIPCKCFVVIQGKGAQVAIADKRANLVYICQGIPGIASSASRQGQTEYFAW